MIDLSAVEADVAPAVVEGRQIMQAIMSIEITTPEQAQWAADVDGELHARAKALTEKKDAWCKPLNKVSRDISATIRTALEPIEHARKVLKAKLAEYRQAEVNRQYAALREAATTEEVQAAAQVLAPRPEGISERVKYSGKVVDERALPRRYWRIDQQLLDADIRQAKGQISIPGVEVQREIVIVRAP